MQGDETTIRDEAALWAVRTGDTGFSDWEGFTSWLEADPAHAPAYDRAVAAVEDAAALLQPPAQPPEAANDRDWETGSAPARRRWAMPALAAALAGLTAIGAWQLQPSEEHFATAPGEMRTIALGDGSRIELAGGSRIAVEGRSARLEQGRALFLIRHDENAPFELVAGRDTLVDVGTTFDVSLGKDRLDVEVAEGAVIVNPATSKIRLGMGERATRMGARWKRGSVSAGAVGGWREGRLDFREASLAEIADQLGRASGINFTAALGSSQKTLSGSVNIAELGKNPEALGPILGVAIRHQGDDWIISAP